MDSILNVLQQILSTPSVLVGLIALVGLVAQKKPIEVVIKGTIKTILGFLVIGAGAGILVGALNYFGALFNFGFGVNGVVPNNEAIVSLALNDYAQATAYIMAFGMAANIVLARFSRLKYIFLTGHHTLYMAALIAVVLTVGGLEGWQLILAGSLLLGLTMALFPAMAQKTMVKITGDDSVAFGHFGTLGYVFSAWIGGLVGKGSKSTEEIAFPKRLSFMRDTSVAISLTMFIFFLVVTGKAVMTEGYDASMIASGQHWIIFSLLQALTFAGGVYVVLAGVRLVLAEIVPAFKGISEKIVPDAKPALDCPVVFPYAENAVLIGFLVSFLGGLVGLGILSLLNGAGMSLALILPGVIPHFFCGATAGVFGNATGGRRGAVLGAFGHGLLITFLPAFLMPVMGTLGFANTTFSDADFTAVGIIVGNIANYVQGIGLLGISVVAFLIPVVYAIAVPKKAAK